MNIFEWIGLLWVLSILLGVGLGIAHFVLYFNDVKWQRKKYINDLIKAGYTVVLINKDGGKDAEF